MRKRKKNLFYPGYVGFVYIDFSIQLKNPMIFQKIWRAVVARFLDEVVTIGNIRQVVPKKIGVVLFEMNA